MTLNTPFHAEHQLDQLAGQFEHWRQTRTHTRDRIPQALWAQAVALTAALPPSRVAKHLRLGWTDLKRQMATLTPKSTAAAPPSLMGFVEVPTTPAWPQAPSTTHIELCRADGTRLAIHSPASTLPLEAFIRAFLGTTTCSN